MAFKKHDKLTKCLLDSEKCLLKYKNQLNHRYLSKREQAKRRLKYIGFSLEEIRQITNFKDFR